MKLLIVILAESDAARAVEALVAQGIHLTRLPSTGGFLRRNNVTLLMGLEAERVEAAIQTLRKACADPTQPGMRRATVLVLPVERFEQL